MGKGRKSVPEYTTYHCSIDTSAAASVTARPRGHVDIAGTADLGQALLEGSMAAASSFEHPVRGETLAATASHDEAFVPMTGRTGVGHGVGLLGARL